jgi:hypothetical protein
MAPVAGGRPGDVADGDPDAAVRDGQAAIHHGLTGTDEAGSGGDD